MITRISKIKGFDNILGGRDLANFFKDGHVYQLSEIMGQIIITDLGKGAVSKYHKQGATFSMIMREGVYLLTQAEYEAELKSKNG